MCGIGFLMVVMTFNCTWYYMNILGWIQYYLVNSFVPELPWTTCGNWWNTDSCRENFVDELSMNTTFTTNNTLIPSYNVTNVTSIPLTQLNSAAKEFWMYNVLRKSDSLEDMGSIQWHLVLSNFVGWLIIAGCLIKGVRSLGKVVYVTATAPYVLLTIILIRGLTLDGSIEGILWYVTPSFEKLASPQVWLEAAVQVFFSLGPVYGGVITMASHNKFHQKSAVETLVCVFADGFTAFYAGFVVFACLGFMAKESGRTVEDIAKTSGPGLAFVAYPEAFGMVETLTHALTDMFPRQLAKHEMSVLAGTAATLFLLSIPFTMQGGIYLFQLADWYVCAFALLAAGFLESVMIGWIYGADRFSCDIKLMVNRPVGKLLRIIWCFIVPFFLMIAFCVTVAMYKTPDYGDGYVYKPYAICIGMALALSPFVPIVVFMIYELYNAEGSPLQRIKFTLKPRSSWYPSDRKARKIYRLQPYEYDKSLKRRIITNILGDKNTPWF
ncbi:Sodium- and chloride-dependent taurine transporter [Mactra antiquata]